MKIVNRVISHLKGRSATDFIRKVFFYITEFKLLSAIRYLRSLYYFKSAVSLGRNVSLKGLAYNVKVGKDVSVFDKCIFELSHNSTLIIGDNCIFSFGVLISSNNLVSIGNYVMVGEYTSIRDTSHSYDDQTKPMLKGVDKYSTVTIGNDVWIGRGCVILPGSIIEDGVVVAANSVIKGHLASNKIYGGAPVRFIKNR